MSLEQVAALRARLSGRPKDIPLSARRAGFEAMMAAEPLPDDVRVEPLSLGTVSALRVSVPGGDADAALLWFHGGQFAIGSAASYRAFGARVARAAGIAVLLADVRLAPEHPFPAPVDDAADALDGALAMVDRLAVGGDSSGANLAVAAVQRRLAAGGRLPAACWLLSPYLDLRHMNPSIAARAARDPFVEPAEMAAVAARYLGGASPAVPAASPILGPAVGFPPSLIQVGSDEALFDDARVWAQTLRAAGGEPLFQEWAGMIHVWPLFAGTVDEGGWAIAQAGAWLQGVLRP